MNLKIRNPGSGIGQGITRSQPTGNRSGIKAAQPQGLPAVMDDSLRLNRHTGRFSLSAAPGKQQVHRLKPQDPVQRQLQKPERQKPLARQVCSRHVTTPG